MTHDEPPDVDARLRAAFHADDRSAARVAQGAFARAARNVAPRRRWRIGVGVAAIAALVLVAFLVRPRLVPVTPAEPPVLSGTLDDGVLVVALPDGSVSITGPGPRTDRPPDGYGIVFVEGASR
jgi:hypothetical protein